MSRKQVKVAAGDSEPTEGREASQEQTKEQEEVKETEFSPSSSVPGGNSPRLHGKGRLGGLQPWEKSRADDRSTEAESPWPGQKAGNGLQVGIQDTVGCF